MLSGNAVGKVGVITSSDVCGTCVYQIMADYGAALRVIFLKYPLYVLQQINKRRTYKKRR